MNIELKCEGGGVKIALQKDEVNDIIEVLHLIRQFLISIGYTIDDVGVKTSDIVVWGRNV